MKSASAPLIALLNGSQQFMMADLYTLTLIGGGVYRYTSWDGDQTWGGNVFSSVGGLFKRSNVRTIIGCEVDELNFTVTAAPTLLIAGVPFLQAVRTGLLDGAMLLLERAFMSVPPAVVGTLIHFDGKMSTATVSRNEASPKIKSFLELLNVAMPRNLYQPGCLHTLFDVDCTLTKSAWKVSSSILAGSTAALLNVSVVQAAGWFSLGTVTFTSGANAGLSRTVKQHVSGQLQLILPLPVAPTVGDTFDAYPGCDKMQATCSAKFSNVAHFRAMPFIPVPETAR